MVRHPALNDPLVLIARSLQNGFYFQNEDFLSIKRKMIFDDEYLAQFVESHGFRAHI